MRSTLLPLFDYLPTDRSGLAWAAPTLQAYLALRQETRFELTARIGELTERLQAMRVTYSSTLGGEAYEIAYRCAVNARHADAFCEAMAAGASRTYAGANIRDATMAENLHWILAREERVVVCAANGHIQRWPFSAPPIVNQPLITLGEHLAASLGDDYRVIGSAFGGGELLLHRTYPDAPPGHTELFTQELRTLSDDSLDELLAGAGMPHYLLDLRSVPKNGPVAERFAAATSIMTGGQATPVDPLTAFDAVVYVDNVTPVHHTFTLPGSTGPAGAGRARSGPG